jgi:glycosyltransferase involved in cell wall biosynthesis
MKIAIAVLTWNRLDVLQLLIRDLHKYCSHHETAIFEDAGQRDGTVDFFNHRTFKPRPDLLALQGSQGQKHIFLGTENLGVSGNSNRAIRWFMNDTDCDYLCLCNDDLELTGDFAEAYARAWKDTGIGLFCFCGFQTKEFAFDIKPYCGHRLKILGRLTGAMMAMPRELIKKIGYFDTRFGKFGEEHCHFTMRAKAAGYQDVAGKPINGIDLLDSFLRHREVESTIRPEEKQHLDMAAAQGVASIDLVYDGLYEPYRLRHGEHATSADGCGIAVNRCFGYTNVVTNDRVGLTAENA